MEIKKIFSPYLLLSIIFIAVGLGQFLRLDILPGAAGGLLIADIVALGVSVVFGFLLVARKIRLPAIKHISLLGVWLGIATFSFLLNAHHYTGKQDLVSFGYLVRLWAYFSIIPLSYLYFSQIDRVVVRFLVYLLIGMLFLGIVILYVLPDFAPLVALGWDPHQGRLTSTWLDPNFFGNFLALVFVFFLPLKNYFKNTRVKSNWLYYSILVILWVGVYFTFSRSSLVTLAIGALFVASFISWRTVGLILTCLVITLALPSRFQGRLNQSLQFSLQHSDNTTGGNGAGSSATSNSANTDPTANARILSWKRALKVAWNHPIFGTGYNFYSYEQARLGSISSNDVEHNRSATGSDSSILTILATTGIVGLIAFLTFWVTIFRSLWKKRREPLCLGASGLLVAWFISSFFNNTLLYALILWPVFILVGVCLHKAVPKS